MSDSMQSTVSYLERLEKKFEKASVDLDVILSDPDFDNDDDSVSLMKSKLNMLSSCFSQLYHKLHLTLQSNEGLVKDCSNLKEELLKEKAKFDATNVETSQLVTQLHALQLQLHLATTGNANDDLEAIKEKLENELESSREEARSQSYMKEEVIMLKKENALLSNRVSKLQDELYGARLAAKYMDKEISGRIQQIQLLGQNHKQFNVEKMWRQLEAEILFHRQKTVIKAHKGANKAIKKMSYENSSKEPNADKIRHVTIHKKLDEGLGISIVGGSEHGVPIIITEIHERGVVDRNGGLMIGDAILSVNGTDIKSASHQAAIQVLTRPAETLNLVVRFADMNEESDDDGSVLEVEIAGSRPTEREPPVLNGKASSSSVVSSSSSSVSAYDSGLEAGAIGNVNENDSKSTLGKPDN